MLEKNLISRNKMNNKAKADNKNIDFTSFIQIDINGHIEWLTEVFLKCFFIRKKVVSHF